MSTNNILLNRGSDGEIYSYMDDKIIKAISLENLNLLEIEIYTKYSSIYITKALKIIIENHQIKIYQSKAEYDLHMLIENKKKKKYLSLEKRLKYIRQLVCGLYYLNTKNVLHGDIKPSNILVYDDVLKYNDFTMSRKINNLNPPRRKLYTLGYRPPECQENKCHKNSDIWALGSTIYELYYAKKYFKFDNSGTRYHLKNLEENKHENNFINKIIQKMMVKDPDKRIDILELYNTFK